MVTFNNLLNNPNILTAAQLGGMRVLEYEKDLSVRPDNAIASYYASEMNVRRRQLLLELKGDSYVVQAGAMQWMSAALDRFERATTFCCTEPEQAKNRPSSSTRPSHWPTSSRMMCL